MATLPGSGTLTLAQIQSHFGGSNPVSLSEYYKNGAYVPSTKRTVVSDTSDIHKYRFNSHITHFFPANHQLI